MSNCLPRGKANHVLSILREGHSIRSAERITGVHRDTIMRLGREQSIALVQEMETGCLLALIASTAYSRRRKWWEETNGLVPDGYAVDASCGNACCFLLEHAFIRPKLDIRTARRVWEYALPHLLELAPGMNMGVEVPPGLDPEQAAVQLRQLLMRLRLMERWSVRVRTDGILVVNRIGSHGGFDNDWKAENYDLSIPEPKQDRRPCACGCGDTATSGAFVDGHLREALKMKLCPGCGQPFNKPSRCCSRTCANLFTQMRRELGYVGKDKKDTAYAY